MPEPLGILLISPGHERAHTAFMLAAAAAAIGRPVTLFATNEACHALTQAAADPAQEAALRAKGVSSLEDLRAACLELGVHLVACDAGLRIAGLGPDALLPGTEIGGLTAFLSATAAGQLVSL